MPSRVMPEQDELQNARVSVLFDYPGKRAAWYDGCVQSAKSSSKAASSQQQPICCLIKYDNGEDEELEDLEAELSGGFLLFVSDDDNTGAWPPRPLGPTSPPTEPEPTAEHWPAGKGKIIITGRSSSGNPLFTFQKKPRKVLTAAATKAAAAEARAEHKAMAAAPAPGPAGKGKVIVTGRSSGGKALVTIQKKPRKVLTAAATKAAAAAEARAEHKAMAAAYLPEQDWSHVQVRM